MVSAAQATLQFERRCSRATLPLEPDCGLLPRPTPR
jgi:hypothetical protein